VVNDHSEKAYVDLKAALIGYYPHFAAKTAYGGREGEKWNLFSLGRRRRKRREREIESLTERRPTRREARSRHTHS